jgi:hypothetical protein
MTDTKRVPKKIERKKDITPEDRILEQGYIDFSLIAKKINHQQSPVIQVLTEVKVHLISEPFNQFLRKQEDTSEEILRSLRSQIAGTAHKIKRMLNKASEKRIASVFSRSSTDRLASIIKRTIKKKDPKAIAHLLRQHPELLFVDDVDLALSLTLELTSEELEELVNEPSKKFREFKIPLRNPFRAHVDRMSFLTEWGDDEEKRVARKCLQDAGLKSFIKLKRGRPRGSVKYSKSEVVADYKRIWGYLKEELSNKNVRLYADKRKIIIQCLTKELTTSIGTSKYDVGGQRYRINKIATRFASLRPFPSNVAIHITALLHDVRPSTVNNILYRSKR